MDRVNQYARKTRSAAITARRQSGSGSASWRQRKHHVAARRGGGAVMGGGIEAHNRARASRRVWQWHRVSIALKAASRHRASRVNKT